MRAQTERVARDHDHPHRLLFIVLFLQFPFVLAKSLDRFEQRPHDKMLDGVGPTSFYIQRQNGRKEGRKEVLSWLRTPVTLSSAREPPTSQLYPGLVP